MLATPTHPEWQTRSATHSGPTSSICGQDGVIDAVDLLGLTWAFIINDNTVERDLVLQIIAHPIRRVVIPKVRFFLRPINPVTPVRFNPMIVLSI